MTDYDINGELESLRDRKRRKPEQPDSGKAAPEEATAASSGVESEVADIKANWKSSKSSKPEQPESGRAVPEEAVADSSGVESEVADIKAAWKKSNAVEPELPAEGEAPELTEEPQIYVVKKGDSLSKIAKEVYGNAGRWREIYEANRDRIDEPNLIRPGWELRIP